MITEKEFFEKANPIIEKYKNLGTIKVFCEGINCNDCCYKDKCRNMDNWGRSSIKAFILKQKEIYESKIEYRPLEIFPEDLIAY